ncbi:MAG: TAXI family TRAP transporter solute-binding subunit [Planctomycetota bacterium]|nr:MAG: TAXI family TRAP transporter solute-binding subunit [Planctomycetota bacterium]
MYRPSLPALSVIGLCALAAAAVLSGCGSSADQDGSSAAAAPAASPFVTIGTGGVTGVYYPVGGAIANMINGRRSELGLRASVESTGGSVYNINAVLSGDLTIGIAQSDRQYEAVNGLGDWAGAPQSQLRAIAGLHQEVITLVAAAEAGIAGVADLRGKRVAIGNPGSGQRGNSEEVLAAFGLDPASDLNAEGLVAAESPRVLQDGRIDAFFYTVGHPNGNITEATSGRRQVRLVPISGEAIDAIVAAKPFYSHARIPMRLYPNAANEEDYVESFGVSATLVTSAAVDEATVYAITQTIFENLERLRGQHPALGGLEAEGMLSGLSAPLHPGAERYLREAGLLAD